MCPQLTVLPEEFEVVNFVFMTLYNDVFISEEKITFVDLQIVF